MKSTSLSFLFIGQIPFTMHELASSLNEQGKPNSHPETYFKFLLGPSWYFHLIWAAYTNFESYINSYTTKGLPVYKEQQRQRRKSKTNYLWTTSSLMSKIQGNQNIRKRFFVVEVCLLLSANISTVYFEQMFVKTLILHVISNNLALQ